MFAEVILPFPLSGTFTYRLNASQIKDAQVGIRVIVPFGARKFYTAIIYRLHQEEPQGVNLKEVSDIIDTQAIITPEQLRLWEWIAEYYQVTLGEIFKAALPSGLKLESETKVTLCPDFTASSALPPTQTRILELLSDEKIHHAQELSKTIGTKNIMPHLYRLLEIDAIRLGEGITENYRPKTEITYRLPEQYQNENECQSALNSLRRAPKQSEAFTYFLHLLTQSDAPVPEVKKSHLIKEAKTTSAILKQLEEKGLLSPHIKEINRVTPLSENTSEMHPLNEVQQLAFDNIHHEWKNHSVVLLHGVTSSGKTEVYIHLMKEMIAQGKQVLFMVPEIALTTQLTERIGQVFGKRMGIYHSKFSDAERIETYHNLLKGNHYDIIVGVRSSVFLPFQNLGLIIVDEEHDTSYKQQEPAPRYHARNTAIILAQLHGAKTLLGTATPAIETYFNVKEGRYGLVEMKKRYKDIQLPQLNVVDMREAHRKKLTTSGFSDFLLEKIQAALNRNEQVILFQNRRGYAHSLECKACGYVARCVHCDVSMTLHRHSNTLVCHYCGHTLTIPTVCPSCQNEDLRTQGVGTEKIEDEIQQLFPTAKIARMDLDTTRRKNSYADIIHRFSQHQVDILVGTQMVTKGLSFDDVSLVAVLHADALLNQPDFRAYERAYQMLEQVSGRAGRMHKRGEVVIQTYQPENPLFTQLANHNYDGFYQEQINERLLFRYPPYHRLINIILKHKDEHTVTQSANSLANNLQQVFGRRCSSTITPIIGRVQSLYVRHILIRIERSASITKAKQIIQTQIQHLHQQETHKNVTIFLDIDPM